MTDRETRLADALRRVLDLGGSDPDAVITRAEIHDAAGYEAIVDVHTTAWPELTEALRRQARADAFLGERAESISEGHRRLWRDVMLEALEFANGPGDDETPFWGDPAPRSLRTVQDIVARYDELLRLPIAEAANHPSLVKVPKFGPLDTTDLGPHLAEFDAHVKELAALAAWPTYTIVDDTVHWELRNDQTAPAERPELTPAEGAQAQEWFEEHRKELYAQRREVMHLRQRDDLQILVPPGTTPKGVVGGKAFSMPIYENPAVDRPMVVPAPRSSS